MDEKSSINERMNFEHEKRLKDLIPRDLIAASIVNLTKDEVESVVAHELTDEYVANVKTFEELSVYTLDVILTDDERVKYQELTSRDYCLNAYREGKNTISFDYRIRKKDGKIKYLFLWIYQ